MALNMLAETGFISKWRFRFKTMVRYRLLFLTSAPIFLTLFALVGITIYWSIHYTWQQALVNISERLDVADNSISLLQQKQANHVNALSNSYDFRVLVNKQATNTEISQWVTKQKVRYNLDFLHWHPNDVVVHPWQLTGAQNETAFFDLLDKRQLEHLDPDLANRAQVPILGTAQVETQGLVSRTIIPVRNQEKEIIGFLDGGLLLNNSTKLVDQIRDLIYPPAHKAYSAQSHQATAVTSNELMTESDSSNNNNTDHLLAEKNEPLGGSINKKRTSSRPVGTVTIFLNDLRVSTNVPLNSDIREGRAIGTRVSHSVHQKVLNDGKEWIDRAYVYDAWYITAYRPLRDQQNNVVGMLYTGYLIWPLLKTYLTNLGEITFTILSLLLISGFMVYRGSRDLFNPIEQIHKVVKEVQMGKNTRIGKIGLDDQHELTQLAKQFDTMLDLLRQRNAQIEQAAAELECKVQVRTASLHEKTQQLEHHIQLLNQTRDKLVVNEKLAALGELTAGIAHEINNPTAVILGNVELMKFELDEDAERVEEEITAIMDQIDRIRNITRSLLQYSRHGGVQDEITWQHVNPILDESITLVKTGAKKRNITYKTDLHAKTSVEVNRNQLLQILVNLQMNAIHSMNGEGQLTVISEDWIKGEENIGAIIHVEDQGCGIKPENLKRIFDPFFTTKRDGTGLGLSVSQSILSQTGGEIRATSTFGEGSRFSVYLPKKSDTNLLITSK